ncbi:MAG TPA: hypothetical protein VFX38_03595 [Gammaproteobacteria bacterium]|nr:hypothetical protein [Gammaproteobacteria bacterium]
MNYRILALIGVRLLAIWLIVLGISALPDIQLTWQAAIASHHPSQAWITFGYAMVMLAIVVPLILGVCLWALGPWLARRITPAEEDAPPDATAPVLVQGAIAIAGLVLAVTTLPGLIFAIVTVVREAAQPLGIREQTWTTFGYRMILILLALGLVVGARRLRDWIFRLRTMGT